MRLIDANALIREAKHRSEVYKTRGLSKAIADMVQDMTIYAPHPYEMRWIPCSERMPEMHEENDCGVKIKVSEPVLFCEKTGLHACVHIGTCMEAFEERWWLSREWKTYKDVTAWMPLPEAYGEED